MKIILLIAICLLTAGSISAQGYIYGPRSDYYYSSDSFYRPRIGFEAGVGLSNTITNGPSASFNTAALTGFNAGIIFDLPVTFPFSVEPEILYSQKGYSATTISGNFTQRTQFIEVPILAKYSLKMVNFFAGPQFSYLAGLKNTYNQGFITANQGFYDNSSNNLYFDVVVGASVNVTNYVELRARYALDLQKNNSNGNNYVPGYSIQAIQMSLGYKF